MPTSARSAVCGRWAAACGIVLAALMLGGLPGPAAGADGAESLEDLLFDLQLVPLDGQPPPAFTLERLGGGRTSLAELGGKVIVLYFWATW
jgi:hypothetical protein